MWWKLKKVFENSKEIVYDYAYESYECTGRLRVDKDSQRIKPEKLAKGDTEMGFSRFMTHVWGVCFEEGAPDERMIAVG